MALGITITDGGVKTPRISLGSGACPFVVGTAKGPTTAGSAPTVATYVASFQEYVTAFGWGGADEETVNHDYTLDEFAYMLFKVKKCGGFVALNVYNATDHSGGVSEVVAADLTAALPELENAVSDLGKIPLVVIAPEYSTDATLRTALFLKTTVGGLPCLVLADQDDTDPVADVLTAAGSLSADNTYLCWPKRGGYPLSTIAAAEMMLSEVENGDKPGIVPSNRLLGVDKEAEENSVTTANVTSLDAAGVITVKRAPGGTERLHIGHTLAYNSGGTADYIHDSYLPQRCANYLDCQLIMKLADRVDNPTNKKLIQDIVAEVNGLGAAMIGAGAFIGFVVGFYDDDNPTEDLMVGKVTFSIDWLPAVQAFEINFKRTVDYSMFSTLFA